MATLAMGWKPTLSSIVLSSRTGHWEQILHETSCRIPASLSRPWPKDSLLCPIDRVASVASHRQAGRGSLFAINVHIAWIPHKGVSTIPVRQDMKLIA
jgi:hypothetical protein